MASDINQIIAQAPSIEAANAAAAPQVNVGAGIADALSTSAALRTDAAQQLAVNQAAAVRAAYADADTSTPGGRGQLVGKLYSIDPSQAQAAAKNFNDADKTKADTANLYSQVKDHLATADMNTAKATLDKATGVNNVFGSIQTFADANPGNTNAINAYYHQQIMDAVQKGLMSSDELGHLPADYDAASVQSHAQMSAAFQAAANDAVDRKQKAALAAQEQAKADADKVSTQKTQAEIDAGKPAADVAETKARTAQAYASAAASRATAGEVGKKEVVIQGADGKPSVGVVDLATGKVVDTGIPASSTRAVATLTPQMRRDNATIVRAANEVSSTLDRLSSVPFTTPGLISADKTHPHGWVDSLFMPSAVPYIQKKLSSEDANNIQALQAGVSRQLATLETVGSGRGPTQANTDQLEKAEMIASGDTIGNAKFKTALWAAHVRQALEGIDEETLTGPQLTVVNKVKKQIANVPDPGTLFATGAPKDKNDSAVAQPASAPKPVVTSW